MDADDFRRAAPSLDGADEGSCVGKRDFRVGSGIYAILATPGMRIREPGAMPSARLSRATPSDDSFRR